MDGNGERGRSKGPSEGHTEEPHRGGDEWEYERDVNGQTMLRERSNSTSSNKRFR